MKGIRLNSQEIKVSHYADDMTLFLNGATSVQRVLEILSEFKLVSGLKINRQKCSIMWLGAERNREKSIFDIRAHKKIQILGMWFSATECCSEDNVDHIVYKI